MNKADSYTFEDVRTWIFDLDNTLYSAECNIFAQIDARMSSFISTLLDIDHEQARRIQKGYYREYGTTLRGLMTLHGVKPGSFSDYVHDIDLTSLNPDEDLRMAMRDLPGKKYIFTNSTRNHAENVAGKLDLLQHVDDIFDIEASHYIPKPQEASYTAFLDRFKTHGQPSAMFEDLSRNLKMPAQLGMITILVRSRSGIHPDANTPWGEPDEPGSHIDHVTNNLPSFLKAITNGLPLPEK